MAAIFSLDPKRPDCEDRKASRQKSQPMATFLVVIGFFILAMSAPVWREQDLRLMRLASGVPA